ncbi:amino acid ABC transporter permease, partial [Mesorhizobium sp. M7A.F.Ca.CA.002.05.1.1]
MIDLLVSLLRGVPATLLVTFGAFGVGAIAAMPLVLMRRSRLLLLSAPARLYIDVVRGIPPIVWLFIIFFGLGSGVIVLSSY